MLGDIVKRNAQLYRGKPAFIMGDYSITFDEYNRHANRLVHALNQRGIGKGDRIAILARNCPAYLDVYAAAEKGGFIIAPLNFRLTSSELAGIINDAQPRVLFVQDSYRATIAEIRSQLPSVQYYVSIAGAPADDWIKLDALQAEGSADEPAITLSTDDLCYLIYTSGTTGTPRATMLTHNGQWLDAAALALEMALTLVDRHLAIMPLYHVGGRGIVLAHTLRGCTVVLHDGFAAAHVLADIETYRITTTQVVPTMVTWLLNEPALQIHDISSLRLIWYASAPMPVDLLKRALDTFGPIFMQGYGQTEAGPLVTSLHAYEHALEGPEAERLASCGRAVPAVEVRIVGPDGDKIPYGEIGEIAVRSPFLMTGYWRQPDISAEVLRDGWLYTGDMAWMDRDGYIYIVDRKKDVIISGGENIYPREIEEVLYTHPAVLEAAVIGVPDRIWGESVKALIVARSGAQVTEDDLLLLCRQRLAGYKCPKSIQFHETLPKSPSGKILKRVLRHTDRTDDEPGS